MTGKEKNKDKDKDLVVFVSGWQYKIDTSTAQKLQEWNIQVALDVHPGHEK